jgi:hypothetical protein
LQYRHPVQGNGRIILYFRHSALGDDLPEDIEDSDKYISIPHKNNLDLGKALVMIAKHPAFFF